MAEERTPEERERARLERERRRAESRGEPLPEPEPAPPADAAPEPEPQPSPEAAPEPELPAQNEQPAPPIESPAEEPAATRTEASGEQEPGGESVEGEPDVPPAHESELQDFVWEDESPAMYTDHPAHEEALAAADAAQAGEPAPYVATEPTAEVVHEMVPTETPDPYAPKPAAPAAVGRAGRTGGSSVLQRGIVVIALLIVVAAVILVVRSGSHSSTSAVKAIPVVKITIPEGKTRQQAAQIARAKGLTGSYVAAARRSKVLSPTEYGAPANTPNLEGFLFPATYELYAGSAAAKLVEEQLLAFKQNFTASFVARAKALGITPYELIIVASLIEKEAAAPSDGPKIAAVIYNRLREGIPIGIDATLYYAIEQERHITTFTSELTEEDLHLQSPYNTRLNKGLPPTPISNPAVAALHDAAYPANASYLYYVLAPSGCNNDYFNTQEEFEAGVARYNAAVSANGGKPPVCKRA